MKFLLDFENEIKNSIDGKKLISEVEHCFESTLENPDVQQRLRESLGKDDFTYHFTGISLHLINTNPYQNPFLRVRLNILNKRTDIPIGYYELEYGIEGQILDDYFILN